MKRPSALVLALLTPFVIAWSVGVEAQVGNCNNGKALYNQIGSCATAGCHNPNPRTTANKGVQKGINPAEIEAAISAGENGMGALNGVFSPSDYNDIAEWIWWSLNSVNTGYNCPAAAPAVSASPTSLNFGNVNTGSSSAPQVITVSNTGTAGATSMNYPAAPTGYSRTTTCAGNGTLAAGTSCTVTVTFSPTAAGATSPTWTITGSPGISIPISLSGNGVTLPPPAPNLLASPPSASFGSVTVGQTSAATNIVLTNSGGSNAAPTFGNSNGTEFKVTNSGSCITVTPGNSCNFNLAYAPTGTGSDSATLTISYGGTSSLVINMSGLGVAAAAASVQASPGSVVFGNVGVGTTSAATTITLSNSGGATAASFAIANGNAARFPVSNNTCGSSLGANASCSLDVAYKPSGPGADSASLTINWTGGSASVNMSGTGTTAATASLAVTPSAGNFGSVSVGLPSVTVSFALSNSGTAAATGLAFANTNAAEFAISGNTCGASLAAGASCAFSITYSPTESGIDNATLTISYAGGASLVLPLNGTGVAGPPPPAGQLSLPVAVTMPNQTVGSVSPPFAVQLSNIGNAAVAVSAVTLSNTGEFALASSTCASVAVGANCTLSFTFTPAAAGLRSTTVTLASNGTGSPQQLVVQGTGVAGGGTTPPSTGNTAEAIEYFHTEFGHYFITAIANEVTLIDNGTFKGWARTGRSFKVYPNAAAGLNPVCRFFSTAFGAKSSHFYTPFPTECSVVKANANWTFEDEVFHVAVPTVTGVCPANTIPVYRMYNNGQSGAPNHRYTTDLAVRAQMLAQGWIAEGEGTIGVIMCAPQ